MCCLIKGRWSNAFRNHFKGIPKSEQVNPLIAYKIIIRTGQDQMMDYQVTLFEYADRWARSLENIYEEDLHKINLSKKYSMLENLF